ncbi:hypothetical protein [Neobacillus sp. 19]|uniref:hypothetical protein n=1 Tax=Neobacillus sp. 19 TaxID=3394458 RepID=UPI003C2C4EA2
MWQEKCQNEIACPLLVFSSPVILPDSSINNETEPLFTRYDQTVPRQTSSLKNHLTPSLTAKAANPIKRLINKKFTN